MKFGIALVMNKFITSIIAGEERKIVDNNFLYKELSISIIPFIICVTATVMNLVTLANVS